MINNKNKIKVGILTFHRAKNYGAVLQAFALQNCLKLMGIDAYIIDRYSGYKSFIHNVYYTFHPKFVVQRITWIIFNQFSKKHLIPKTKVYKTKNSLNDFHINENFDAIIVGSDQIWRMEFSLIGYNYFLDFIDGKDIRKISYAASFGKDKWSERDDVTLFVRKLLHDFNSISVREKSGVNICSDIFQLEGTHVLDPTLLLKKEYYESKLLDSKGTLEPNNFIVSYLLGNKKDDLKFCNSFAIENGFNFLDLYHIYSINNLFSENDYGEKRYFHLSVQEWLNQIRNAQYVITNSYHATIFAIIFSKQFIVIDHPDGGTDRIISLLELLGLKDRFVKNVSEISLKILKKNIDWNIVFEILENEKIHSINFIKKSIF